jgi:hypothetical protein
MDCEKHFCERHSDVARALRFCMEYELDLHKAPDHEKQLCMKKLNLAISILHQAITYNQDELYNMYILNSKPKPEIAKYEINTDDIPFTE